MIHHTFRFVYHDLSSNKVDAEVEYPLQDLNLSQYTSGPDSGSLTYDLYSIVCHFGGKNKTYRIFMFGIKYMQY